MKAISEFRSDEMPTKTLQNTIKLPIKSLTSYKWTLVINEFIVNGRNAPKAYLKAYPDCKTHFQAANQLFKNIKFATMLEKRMQEIREKNDIEIGRLEAMYQSGFNTASKQANPAGMAQNTTGIARLYGKDKDAGAKDATVIIINPPNTVKNVESEVIDEV